MAYVRFSGVQGPHPYVSSVYIYDHVKGGLECCGCLLNAGNSFWVESVEFMVKHVEVHIDCGHPVPEFVLPSLLGEVDRYPDATLTELVERAREEGAQIGTWDADCPAELRIQAPLEEFIKALADGDLQITDAQRAELAQGMTTDRMN